MIDCLPAAKNKWIHSLIFLRIPKTASSSIISCLADRNLVWKHRGLFAQKFQKLPIYRGIFDPTHATPDEIFSVIGKQVFDYFSFAVVREPIQRLISAFFFGKQKKLWPLYNLSGSCSFEEFVDFLCRAKEGGRNDILILKQQVDWTHNSVFRPTTIIRYENLNSEWANMLEEHKIEGLPMELPWENRSEKEEISLSKCIKIKIEKMFARDFELLGY